MAINSGEVEFRETDIFGEPVNLAARLEGIAESGEVWFTEGYSGFYVMKITNGVWPFTQQPSVLAQQVSRPRPAAAAPPARAPAPAPAVAAQLAATGGTVPVGGAILVLALGLLLRRARRLTSSS